MKVIEFLVDQREVLQYYRVVWTFVLFAGMIFLQHTTKKSKIQSHNKNKKDQLDGGIN